MSLTTGRSNAFTTVVDLIEAMSKKDRAAAAGVALDEPSVDVAPIAIKALVKTINLKIDSFIHKRHAWNSFAHVK